jgi:hypothetical protein
VVPPDPLQVSV